MPLPLRHLRLPAALAATLAIVLLLPWVPPFDSNFEVQRLGAAAALVIIVVGLNLLTGSSGQISLGHSGLVLVGAYIAATLITSGFLGQDVPPLLAVIVAGLGTAVIGFLLGLPAARLGGPYLAIATLVLAIAVPIVLKHSSLADITNGTRGIVLASPRAPSSIDGLANTDQWRYYLIALPMVVLCFFAWNLNQTRFGRALRAIRDSELGARQMGIHVALYKTLAFSISAGYAGLGGALLTYVNVGFVGPDSYNLFDSIGYLTAIVVGGLGSIVGSILGALFVAYQMEVVNWLANETWTFNVAGTHLFSIPSPLAYALGLLLQGRWGPVSNPSDLRWFIYGLVLIAVVSLMPGGAVGFAGRMWAGRHAAWQRLVGAAQAGIAGFPWRP